MSLHDGQFDEQKNSQHAQHINTTLMTPLLVKVRAYFFLVIIVLIVPPVCRVSSTSHIIQIIFYVLFLSER